MTVRLVLRQSAGKSRRGRGRVAQWFFLVAGLLAIGYSAFSVVERNIYQASENRLFDQELVLRKAAPHRADDSAEWAGRIEIPRLKISAIVKEGVDDRTLDLAAGHIPHTALPGQPGNVGVAAHRDTLFRNLKDVRRDDMITLTTFDGEYSYRVVSFQIVQPANVSVLDPSPENTLTLVTCYPFYFVGKASKRFIVRALQVF